MTDRGVVNAAEVLAEAEEGRRLLATIQDQMGELPHAEHCVYYDGDEYPPSSCRCPHSRVLAAANALLSLASSPSGDGGPVVIFPDGTVEPYPTLSEEERFVLRSALEDYSGSEAEHAHDLTLHSPDRLAEAHLLVDRCRVADALADRLAPPAIQDGTGEEGGDG